MTYRVPTRLRPNVRLMEVIERMKCTNEGVEQTYESIMYVLKTNPQSFSDVAETIELVYRKHPERKTHLAYLYGNLTLNNNQTHTFNNPEFIAALEDIGVYTPSNRYNSGWIFPKYRKF